MKSNDLTAGSSGMLRLLLEVESSAQPVQPSDIRSQVETKQAGVGTGLGSQWNSGTGFSYSSNLVWLKPALAGN